jgi:hypothetical protein
MDKNDKELRSLRGAIDGLNALIENSNNPVVSFLSGYMGMIGKIMAVVTLGIVLFFLGKVYIWNPTFKKVDDMVSIPRDLAEDGKEIAVRVWCWLPLTCPETDDFEGVEVPISITTPTGPKIEMLEEVEPELPKEGVTDGSSLPQDDPPVAEIENSARWWNWRPSMPDILNSKDDE